MQPLRQAGGGPPLLVFLAFGGVAETAAAAKIDTRAARAVRAVKKLASYHAHAHAAAGARGASPQPSPIPAPRAVSRH